TLVREYRNVPPLRTADQRPLCQLRVGGFWGGHKWGTLGGRRGRHGVMLLAVFRDTVATPLKKALSFGALLAVIMVLGEALKAWLGGRVS
ncbi:MAG: hypothetical protein ACREXW_03365, partial [Gammaproteobacteria bacterium]